jgi:molybdenum cofactor cytidylyltransferase
MSAAALILAAGASSRLGSPKQLARLGEETLLERAVRIAGEAGCSPVLVVLGANAEEIQAGCKLGTAEILQNPGWAQGMGSSLRLGIERLSNEAAVVVLTCDQPAVSAGHLRQLMIESEGLGKAVASAYGGRHGVPACFPAACFGDLLRVEGDSGARSLLASAHAIALVDGDLDVDTAESLREARRRFGGERGA